MSDDLSIPLTTDNPLGLISDEDLSKHLRVSTDMLRRWRQRRTGPAFSKVGRSVVYQVKDVVAWIDSKKVEPVA